MGANDVSECFSPPRVVPLAWKRGLQGGWALDIKAQDANGQVWDLRDPKVVKRAKQLIRKTKPKVLIGSPPCTWWSSLMSLNFPKMTEEQKRKGMAQARLLLEVMAELYWVQISEGGLHSP